MRYVHAGRECAQPEPDQGSRFAAEKRIFRFLRERTTSGTSPRQWHTLVQDSWVVESRQALTRVRFHTRRGDSHVDHTLWQTRARSTEWPVAGHQVRQQSLIIRLLLNAPALVSGNLFVVHYEIGPWDLLTPGLSILREIPCLQMWSFPRGLQRTCKSCIIQTTSGITCQIRCRTRLSSSRAPIRKRHSPVVCLYTI